MEKGKNQESFTKGQKVNVTYLGQKPYTATAEVLEHTSENKVRLKLLSGRLAGEEFEFIFYGDWKCIFGDPMSHRPVFSKRGPGYLICAN